MRIAGALVAVAVLAAAVSAIASTTTAARPGPVPYETPDVGEVVGVVAPDGAPAFLTRDDDGDVRAFLGIAPHSGLPLAWCPDEQLFIEPLGSSRFDITGTYLFGPSPHGLFPYAAAVRGGEVQLADRIAPEPRPDPAPLGEGTAGRPLGVCAGTDGYALGVRAPTEGVRIAPLHAALGGGWTLTGARAEERRGSVALCRPSTEPCAPGDQDLPALTAGRLPEGGASIGATLVRGERGTLVEAVVPLRIDAFYDQKLTRAPPDAWCAAADLAAIHAGPDQGGASSVSLRNLRPPSADEPGCDYGADPVPEALHGADLDAPLRGYARDVTYALAYAPNDRAEGPYPTPGSADDVLDDGTTTAAELGPTLGLGEPVGVLVRYDAGDVTGLWVPPLHS